MDSIGFLLMIAAIGAFFVGAQPTIRVYPPEDNCQRVHISRFWESVTIVDAVMCDGQEFNWNGENLLDTPNE